MLHFGKPAFLKRYANPLEMGRDGIMGMNQRNINYISRYNRRSLYPLVDNKLKTKGIAVSHHVNTPKLIGSVQDQHDIQNVLDIIGDHSEFCIKPAQGSGGKGILVIKDRNAQNGHFIKSSGEEINNHDLRRHLTNILAGLFSLSGRQDLAVIEELIHFDNVFSGFSYDGVPDTRVIVFQGFPVMCMMRLSTLASDGKANLHQGAVGVGICVRTGRAVRAVQFNQPIEFHPDTDIDTVGIGREVQTLAYILQPLASAATDREDQIPAGIDLIPHMNFVAVFRFIHGAYGRVEEEVHMILHLVIEILEHNIIDVCSEMPHLRIQQMQTVFQAHALDLRVGGGIQAGSRAAVIQVNLIHIAHEIQGFFFPGILKERSTELVGNVIFSVRKGARAAEAAHDAADRAADTGLHLFPVDGALTQVQRPTEFKNGHLQSAFHQFISGVDASGPCTDHNHVIVH